MVLNEECHISVFTHEIHFSQEATETQMTLITCSRSQRAINSHTSPITYFPTYISRKLRFLQSMRKGEKISKQIYISDQTNKLFFKKYSHGPLGQRWAAFTGQLDISQGLWNDVHFVNFLSERKSKGELLSLGTLAGLEPQLTGLQGSPQQNGNIDKVLAVSSVLLSPLCSRALLTPDISANINSSLPDTPGEKAYQTQRPCFLTASLCLEIPTKVIWSYSSL